MTQPETDTPQTQDPLLQQTQVESTLAVAAYVDSIREYWEPRARQAEMKSMSLKQQLLQARADLAVKKKVDEAPSDPGVLLKAAGQREADLKKRLENLHGEHKRVVEGLVDAAQVALNEMMEKYPDWKKTPSVVQAVGLLKELMLSSGS